LLSFNAKPGEFSLFKGEFNGHSVYVCVIDELTNKPFGMFQKLFGMSQEILGNHFSGKIFISATSGHRQSFKTEGVCLHCIETVMV